MFMSIFIAADGEASRELVWAADALTSSCPACAAVAVYLDGRTLLLHGTFPAALPGADFSAAVAPGPLLRKVLEKVSAAPDYLPALQLLPGRVKFSYLPAAAQAVECALNNDSKFILSKSYYMKQFDFSIRARIKNIFECSASLLRFMLNMVS